MVGNIPRHRRSDDFLEVFFAIVFEFRHDEVRSCLGAWLICRIGLEPILDKI